MSRHKKKEDGAREEQGEGLGLAWLALVSPHWSIFFFQPRFFIFLLGPPPPMGTKKKKKKGCRVTKPRGRGRGRAFAWGLLPLDEDGVGPCERRRHDHHGRELIEGHKIEKVNTQHNKNLTMIPKNVAFRETVFLRDDN